MMMMMDECRDCDRTPGLGSTILCNNCRDIEGERIKELESALAGIGASCANNDSRFSAHIMMKVDKVLKV